jgi:hypothetical protein
MSSHSRSIGAAHGELTLSTVWGGVDYACLARIAGIDIGGAAPESVYSAGAEVAQMLLPIGGGSLFRRS